MQDCIPLEGDRASAVIPLSNFPLLEVVSISILIAFWFLLSGCAVYYRDHDTGAEHIFGFGHLAVKTIPPHEGKQALVQRMTLAGIAVGLDNGTLGVSAGWDRREHIVISSDNTAMTITRDPSNDFFYFKVGTYPLSLGIPQAIEISPAQKEKQQ